MKINATNTEKLQKALTIAEGRATARTVTPDDIMGTIESIELTLIAILPKKDWPGLKFVCCPNAQEFPNSYRFTPHATEFQLLRGATGWFITDIYRAVCKRSSQSIRPLNLDDYSTRILDYTHQPKQWS